jgi:DNA-binding NarL/FixJ family response regulator
MLLVNESRPRRALQVAGAAAAVRERIGSDSPPPWARECERTLSKARKAVGVELAHRLFEEGRETSIESALELAGLRQHRSEPEREHSSVNSLTARQREIASLVAQGLTNQQIGRTLHVSVRTVDAHLDHIRARLEVKSRAEIAAWAIQSSQ